MDLNIIGEALFFLGTALLAINVTIHVLASSLLGSVAEVSREEEERLKEKERHHSELERERMKRAIAAGYTLEKPVRNMARDVLRARKNFERQLRQIRGRYAAFTPEGGVLRPSVFLLLSIGFSVAAWGGDPARVLWVGHAQVPLLPILVGLSFLSMGLGVGSLPKALRVIHHVARRADQLRRPLLAAELESTEATVGKGQDLVFRCRVVGGRSARDATLVVAVPDSLGPYFGSGWTEADLTEMDAEAYNPCTVRAYELGQMLPPTIRQPVILVQPHKIGQYKVAYFIMAFDYCSHWIETEVYVSPPPFDLRTSRSPWPPPPDRSKQNRADGP